MQLDEHLSALFASDPAALSDPFPVYRALREQSPIHEFDGAVLVSTYADARIVLRHPTYSKAEIVSAGRALGQRAQLSAEYQRLYDEVTEFEGREMNLTDPPDHDRLRRIAHRAFTPARINALRERIQGYADSLLEPMAGEDVVDLSGFAYQLPLMVVSDMLGIPAADREMIHEWSARIGQNKGKIEAGPLADAHAALQDFRAYVHAIVEDHRGSSAPVSELVATLVDATQEERLTTEELTAMFVVLLFAGHDTTTNLIAIGTYELLRRPDQWRQLRDEPDVVTTAVEELLRYVTPVQWIPRVAKGDQELGGTVIADGTTVFAMLAAANRDPAEFSDPERLDVRRPEAKRQVSLGFGPHFCLGASLARLEGAIAFGTLARRFPDLALRSDTPVWGGKSPLRRLMKLEVELGDARLAAHR
jgi:cytochrome P450